MPVPYILSWMDPQSSYTSPRMHNLRQEKSAEEISWLDSFLLQAGVVWERSFQHK